MLKNLWTRSKKVLKKLSSKSKILITVLAIAASILPYSANIANSATGTVVPQGIDSPRFNFREGDKEMLRMAKPTDTAWSDPLSAQNGDRVEFLLYYHNGVENTTAHNTKVRVDLPTTESNQFKMTSFLWSDETPFITDTVVNGQIIGLSGGTINLPTSAKIKYIPGTTKLFANRSTTGVALPDGITTSGGINIGDIQGCWQYSGLVGFAAQIFGNTQLTLAKTVAKSDLVWQEQVPAMPNETVNFRMIVKNSGDLKAVNASLKDQLPTYLNYVSGSTFADLNNTGSFIKLPDTLTTSGVGLGTLTNDANKQVIVKFQAKVDGNIPAGSQLLVNWASLFLGGVFQTKDSASVAVNTSSAISLEKTVFDATSRSWAKSTTGTLGDIKSFSVIVKNTGSRPLNNVVIRDILPIFTSLSGDVKLNGRILSASEKSQLLGSGLNIGSLPVSGSATLTLQVLINGCPPLGNSTLINTAYASAIGINQIISSALINIHIDPPTDPSAG